MLHPIVVIIQLFLLSLNGLETVSFVPDIHGGIAAAIVVVVLVICILVVRAGDEL